MTRKIETGNRGRTKERLHMTFDDDFVQVVDALADRYQLTRSAMMRELMDQGIARLNERQPSLF